MLHSCAEYLTHTLYRHCPLSEEKRPVFVYGFELSLSTLSSILSITSLDKGTQDAVKKCGMENA